MVNKMYKCNLEIISNELLTNKIYRMVLKGENRIENPGSFVEVTIPGFYLKRPISVADYTNDTLTLIYKVLGHGTDKMSTMLKGESLEVLTDLGNGFTNLTKNPLIVAGGIGVAPFVNLVKKFNELGIKPTMIYGEQTKENYVLLDFFKENTKELILVTDDGSSGIKGNPCSYLSSNKIDFDKYYACGPNIMLKNLTKLTTNGYLSLEARMGCGFGACMGCSIETTKGPKRVCKEGPIFEASEVIYE